MTVREVSGVCSSGDMGSSDTAERGPGSGGLSAEARRAQDLPLWKIFHSSRDDTLRFAFD